MASHHPASLLIKFLSYSSMTNNLWAFFFFFGYYFGVPESAQAEHATFWGGSSDCLCGNDVLTFVFLEGIREKERKWWSWWRGRKHARAMGVRWCVNLKRRKSQFLFQLLPQMWNEIQSRSHLFIKPLLLLRQLFFGLLDHGSPEGTTFLLCPFPSLPYFCLCYCMWAASVSLSLSVHPVSQCCTQSRRCRLSCRVARTRCGVILLECL